MDAQPWHGHKPSGARTDSRCQSDGDARRGEELLSGVAILRRISLRLLKRDTKITIGLKLKPRRISNDAAGFLFATARGLRNLIFVRIPLRRPCLLAGLNRQASEISPYRQEKVLSK
jgi:hypothetical protein